MAADLYEYSSSKKVALVDKKRDHLAPLETDHSGNHTLAEKIHLENGQRHRDYDFVTETFGSASRSKPDIRNTHGGNQFVVIDLYVDHMVSPTEANK